MKEIEELFEKIKGCIDPQMDMRQLQMLRSMAENLACFIRCRCYDRQEALVRLIPFLKDVDMQDVHSYGQCGDRLYWKIRDDVLYIGGEGEMWDFGGPFFNRDLSPWYHQDFGKIVIEEGATSIGTYAFAEADISTVKIPSSLERIGAGAFFEASISVLNLPGTLYTIEQDIIAADPCRVSELVLSCDIPCIAPEAFYIRYGNLDKITLTGNMPENITALVESFLFRFVPGKVLYPRVWDTREHSFPDLLCEALELGDEITGLYEDELEKLRKVLIPYD